MQVEQGSLNGRVHVVKDPSAELGLEGILEAGQDGRPGSRPGHCEPEALAGADVEPFVFGGKDGSTRRRRIKHGFYSDRRSKGLADKGANGDVDSAVAESDASYSAERDGARTSRDSADEGRLGYRGKGLDGRRCDDLDSAGLHQMAVGGGGVSISGPNTLLCCRSTGMDGVGAVHLPKNLDTGSGDGFMETLRHGFPSGNAAPGAIQQAAAKAQGGISLTDDRATSTDGASSVAPEGESTSLGGDGVRQSFGGALLQRAMVGARDNQQEKGTAEAQIHVQPLPESVLELQVGSYDSTITDAVGAQWSELDGSQVDSQPGDSMDQSSITVGSLRHGPRDPPPCASCCVDRSDVNGWQYNPPRRHAFQRPMHALQISALSVIVISVFLFFSAIVPAYILLYRFGGFSECLGEVVALSVLLGVFIIPACCLMFIIAFRENGDISNEGEPCAFCRRRTHTDSRHCKACNKCITGFDHHCKWLNMCIGSKNYKLFIAFLFTVLCSVLVALTSGSVLLFRWWEQLGQFALYFRGGSVVLCLMMLVTAPPVIHLLGFHAMLKYNGITTFEYIMGKRRPAQQGPRGAAVQGEGRIEMQTW